MVCTSAACVASMVASVSRRTSPNSARTRRALAVTELTARRVPSQSRCVSSRSTCARSERSVWPRTRTQRPNSVAHASSCSSGIIEMARPNAAGERLPCSSARHVFDPFRAPVASAEASVLCATSSMSGSTTSAGGGCCWANANLTFRKLVLSNNCASVGLSTGGSGCRLEARGGDTAFICSGADIEMPPLRFHLSGDIAEPNI